MDNNEQKFINMNILIKNMSQLIKYLGTYPLIKVIDFFIENILGQYTKTDISNATGVSRTTLQKICEKLQKKGFLKIEKKGDLFLYSINRGSIFSEKIIDLDYCLNINKMENESRKKIKLKIR